LPCILPRQKAGIVWALAWQVKPPQPGISRLAQALADKEKDAVIDRRIAAVVLTLAAAPALAAPAEKPQMLSGIVQSYSPSEHRFVVKDESGREVPFAWTKDTKFNGVVATGAKVTVRYTPQADGPNLAQTVGILK
jgi:hypothetical protein